MLRSWRLAVRLWLRSPWLAASVIVSLGMSIALGVTMSAILDGASRQAALFPKGPITTALVVAALPPLRRAQRVSPALLMRSE